MKFIPAKTRFAFVRYCFVSHYLKFILIATNREGYDKTYPVYIMTEVRYIVIMARNLQPMCEGQLLGYSIYWQHANQSANSALVIGFRSFGSVHRFFLCCK